MRVGCMALVSAVVSLIIIIIGGVRYWILA